MKSFFTSLCAFGAVAFLVLLFVALSGKADNKDATFLQVYFPYMLAIAGFLLVIVIMGVVFVAVVINQGKQTQVFREVIAGELSDRRNERQVNAERERQLIALVSAGFGIAGYIGKEPAIAQFDIATGRQLTVAQPASNYGIVPADYRYIPEYE
jgi:hypothetical protein